MTRRATIPKPGKVLASQVISGYLPAELPRQSVEKIAAMLVGAYCEAKGTFHPGQCGCQAQRSAMDAVAMINTRT